MRASEGFQQLNDKMRCELTLREEEGTDTRASVKDRADWNSLLSPF